jgi:uncharacterized protein
LSKLLLLLAAAAVVYFVIRGMIRRSDGPRRAPPPAERMVACGHCGINLPQSEALESSGRFYCSEEHRRLAGP